MLSILNFFCEYLSLSREEHGTNRLSGMCESSLAEWFINSRIAADNSCQSMRRRSVLVIILNAPVGCTVVFGQTFRLNDRHIEFNNNIPISGNAKNIGVCCTTLRMLRLWCSLHIRYRNIRNILRYDQIEMYWWNIYRALLINIDIRVFRQTLENKTYWLRVSKRMKGDPYWQSAKLDQIAVVYDFCRYCCATVVMPLTAAVSQPLNNFMSRVSKWNYGNEQTERSFWSRVVYTTRNLVYQIVVSDIFLQFLMNRNVTYIRSLFEEGWTFL